MYLTRGQSATENEFSDPLASTQSKIVANF